MGFTILFLWGPLLMGLSFTTTAMLERNRFLHVFFQSDLIFRIAPVVVLFIAFTMLFWLVPSTRVKFSAAAAGAVVTAALFSMVRFGFGLYANYLFHGRFNLIYGTLELAVYFMFPFHGIWCAILK